MKPHINIKLRNGMPAAALPHWAEILADKTRAGAGLHPAVDEVLVRHRVPVWVTREYKPAQGAWSHAEVESGLDRIYRLILQEERGIPPAMIEEIRLLPMVEYVRAGAVARVDLPPMEAAAFGARPDQRSRDSIYLDEAHRYTRGDPSITVAILDTGVSGDHPELKDALLEGYDFVDILDGAGKFFGDYLEADPITDDVVGHGTHVAGIVAGKGLAMPPGVAPRCKLLPVRVLGALSRGDKLYGAGLVDNINAGFKWAVDQDVDVINASLGVRHTGGGLPHAEVVDYARRKGVTIVAASGNDGREESYYPGALPYVLAVGAVDVDDRVAAFSTWGEQVAFVAPGTEIYSSYLNKDYAYSTGTSHAAPFVAGAAALLKSYARQRGKSLSDGQVKHILKHTADRADQRLKDRKMGFGRINLIDALRLLEYKLN